VFESGGDDAGWSAGLPGGGAISIAGAEHYITPRCYLPLTEDSARQTRPSPVVRDLEARNGVLVRTYFPSMRLLVAGVVPAQQREGNGDEAH
jgi:hypothetical protein